MGTRLIIFFLLGCLLIGLISILFLIHQQAGANSLKYISFIWQLIGVITPLSIISKEAFTNTPPFIPREHIEDPKSSMFDLRRDECSNEEWRKANHFERKILSLQYKLDDLESKVKSLSHDSAIHKIWFRKIWDNSDYLFTHVPKEKALEQFYPLFFGSILTIIGSFISFWNVELYNSLESLLN
ncbi:hypothetical protein [Wohlfahrtiimonas chitiniclastica]|uniref:hypothetical protein n=1 Tax=Wohlfahrtiimonas chitiniclastica TaxID=400946 RepID=UPI001BCA9855|nr:hypothetical protein [Wohlfahrtiimonas chitiniclastica]MBS7819016.1 hypothetical protein [Wohlfahrtiimonas chitiniclastica]